MTPVCTYPIAEPPIGPPSQLFLGTWLRVSAQMAPILPPLSNRLRVAIFVLNGYSDKGSGKETFCRYSEIQTLMKSCVLEQALIRGTEIISLMNTNVPYLHAQKTSWLLTVNITLLKGST